MAALAASAAAAAAPPAAASAESASKDAGESYPTLTHGPITGEVQAHQFSVWGRFDRPGMVNVYVYVRSENKKEKGPQEEEEEEEGQGEDPSSREQRGNLEPLLSISGEALAEADNTVTIVVGNEAILSPDTAYYVTFNQVPLSQASSTDDFKSLTFVASVRTCPAHHQVKPLHFVFGSCVGGQGFGRTVENGWPIFSNVQKCLGEDGDFVLLLGDAIYADDKVDSPFDRRFESMGLVPKEMCPGAERVCETREAFHARYRWSREDPHWSGLLRRYPMFSTWDDHEIHDDFGPHTVSESLFQEGKAAYFDYFPLQGPAEEPFRMYRSFRWGSLAEFFILDTRQYRAKHDFISTVCVNGETEDAGEDGSSGSSGDDGGGDGDGEDSKRNESGISAPVHKSPAHAQQGNAKRLKKTPRMNTMLGAEQVAWLKQAVGKSTATWKFICSSVPVSFPTGWPNPEETGYDGWSGEGAKQELWDIISSFKEQGVRNFLFLSGDVHFPAVLSYDPWKQGQPLFWELISTPFSALPLAPSVPSEFFNPTLHWTCGEFAKGPCNFGDVRVASDGTITFQARDAQGTVLHEQSISPS